MKKLFLILSTIFLLSTNANATALTWEVTSGGNGHSYELVDIAGGITWTDARDAAAAMGGHLATISSEGENSFIFNQLAVGTKPLWLGAYQEAGTTEPLGAWQWVTGEDWGVYVNWAGDEPNNSTGGNEDSLAFAFFEANGSWNDAPTTWLYSDGGYVVEYNPVPEPATMLLFGLGILGLAGVSRKTLNK